MNRIYKVMLCMLFTLFLCACGQRGPLYLPEPAPTNQPEQEKSDDLPSNTNVNEGQ